MSCSRIAGLRSVALSLLPNLKNYDIGARNLGFV